MSSLHWLLFFVNDFQFFTFSFIGLREEGEQREDHKDPCHHPEDHPVINEGREQDKGDQWG